MRFPVQTVVVWTGFVCWLVTTVILSSIPGSRLAPLPFPEADKVAHALIYAVGGGLFFVGLRVLNRFRPPIEIILAAGAMILLSMSDEIHQLWTPGRSGWDHGDLSADFFGAGIGILIALLFHGRRREKSNQPASGADRAA